MNVTVQFDYGYNYAAPSGKHCERYGSIKEAKEVFSSRLDFDPRFPCVDSETSHMLVYFGLHKDVTDFYPDRSYAVGKKGGIIREF